MPVAALCLAFLSPLDPAKTTLVRKFTTNEKLAYAVRSHLTSEQRQRGLQTWLPSDTDIDYNFSFLVKGLQADGVAVINYARPTMTISEDGSSGSRTKVEKIDMNLRIVLSPVNEMIEAKSLTPEKPKKEQPESNGEVEMVGPEDANRYALAVFGRFMSEAQRMALFIGSLDSSIDLSPKLPLEPVAIGDTWKRTVGYQPQKLSGKDGKAAVQRLDYTFTYLGPKTVDGKPVLRIQAKLNFKTDLIDYVKPMFEEAGSKTFITSLPLTLDATIDYDLDPKTRHTLATRATSSGGYGLYVKSESDAIIEGRFKGRTDVDLVGHKLNVKQ
jgi:hypothetical protein